MALALTGRAPRRPRSRGVAALELALSLTFLVPLLMGTLDFGYYFYIGTNAEEAARAGVREAVLASGGALCGTAASNTAPKPNFLRESRMYSWRGQNERGLLQDDHLISSGSKSGAAGSNSCSHLPGTPSCSVISPSEKLGFGVSLARCVFNISNRRQRGEIIFKNSRGRSR